MRQRLSGCLCSSADWPGLNGGSNQNQRSVGKSASMITSAIRKLSSNTRPTKSRPSIERVSESAPSQAISQSALKRIGAVRRDHLESDVIVARLDRGDTIAAADLDRLALRRKRLQALIEKVLEPVLLQVDERRALVPALGQEIELVDLPVAEEHLAVPPLHALVHHRLAAAEAVEDFERAFGEADRARAPAHLVVLVENDDGDVVQRAIDGGGQADRTRADDDDGVPSRRRAVLIGRPLVGVERRLEDLAHSAPYPCNCAHISRSRAAVQMRGVSMPSASS